jgi:hypothetical protein
VDENRHRVLDDFSSPGTIFIDLVSRALHCQLLALMKSSAGLGRWLLVSLLATSSGCDDNADLADDSAAR